MLNLYWKTGGQTRSLIEKPFKSEAEFEKYIFENQDLLGDIFIIYRQIRTGHKQGIPDMLGVDQDSRICIIELKNVEADESILPQALSYGIWAETNPDSVKALWLESKEKPEDVEIDWDNMDIRLILIAPAFKATVLHMASKIGYSIDLVQVRRYYFEDEEFLVVEILEEEKRPRVSTTKSMGNWDWDYYEAEHGKEATTQFRTAVNALNSFVQQQGWDLPYNINKYYTGFKLGNKVVFSVQWSGTYAWKLAIKLPRELARAFQAAHWEFQSYDETFRNAIFRPVTAKVLQINELEPLLTEAYKRISGSK